MLKVEHNGQKITPLEIFNACVELMNSSNIEDDVVIYLMYSLSINLSTIALLSFDFIDEMKNLTYFNTKTSPFVIVKLNDHLYGDLEYFREYKIKNGIKKVQNERSYLNKIKNKGDFITTLASKGILRDLLEVLMENWIGSNGSRNRLFERQRLLELQRNIETQLNQSVWWRVAWLS